MPASLCLPSLAASIFSLGAATASVHESSPLPPLTSDLPEKYVQRLRGGTEISPLAEARINSASTSVSHRDQSSERQDTWY